jgi:ABC-type multidrug transport system ATPase subunit
MLSIRSLSKRYPGGTVGLSDFSLEAGEGVLGLLGPNGAGKSTLMAILATVTKPTSGTFLWEGRDAVADPLPLRRQLGYLPQDFGVYERLTAREFLIYLGRLKGLSGVDLARRVQELLELTNLHGAADRRLSGYSGGMRQRVGIAQALLNDPRVLIVDEPTRGVDVGARAEIYRILRDLRDRGLAILVVSSDLPEVLTLADRILVMANGRTVGELEGATATEEAVVRLATRHATSELRGAA